MFTRKHRIYVAAVACALSVFAGSAAEAGRKPGVASGSGAIAATAAPRSTTLAAGKLGGVDGMHIPMSSFAAELVLAAGKMGSRWWSGHLRGRGRRTRWCWQAARLAG